MTMMLVLAVAVVVGVSIQSRWALLLPASLGLAGAAAIVMTGHDLSDTPIPFLIVMSTLAMGAGMQVRSRLMPASPKAS